jgi:hypothetical protein
MAVLSPSEPAVGELKYHRLPSGLKRLVLWGEALAGIGPKAHQTGTGNPNARRDGSFLVFRVTMITSSLDDSLRELRHGA